MSTDDIFCTKCGEKLDPKTAVWLELDQRYGRYYREGIVPALYSQGGFPFGKACARKTTTATRHADNGFYPDPESPNDWG